MKVDLIKKSLEEYRTYLQKRDQFYEAYLWDAFTQFQNNWDIEALDFHQMFDQAFQSSLSLRLWKREHYFPKEIILKMISIDKEMMRTIFRDLLNDVKDLNLRVNRFIHHLDQMLAILQKSDQNLASHFHADLEMVFVYLSFVYPDKYCLYQFESFLHYLKKVGSSKNLRIHDPIFFSKMCKATRTIMMKDAPLLELFQSMELKFDLPMNVEMLWVQDFYRYTGLSMNQN